MQWWYLEYIILFFGVFEYFGSIDCVFAGMRNIRNDILESRFFDVCQGDCFCLLFDVNVYQLVLYVIIIYYIGAWKNERP